MKRISRHASFNELKSGDNFPKAPDAALSKEYEHFINLLQTSVAVRKDVEGVGFVDVLQERYKTEKNKNVPKFGSAKGKIKMSADFDAPLEDFKDYM